MYRIVGLWNNAEEYSDTPHNIGGQVLSEMLRKKEFDLLGNVSEPFLDSKRKAQVSKGSYLGEDFELLLSEGFMNDSGNVFSGVFTDENESGKEKVVVVYDDIDLPFGKVKVSFGRGDGGHNGIKDIAKKLGTKNFVRIRVGVCPLDFFGKPRKPKGAASVKYLVSKKFSRKYGEKAVATEKVVGGILESLIKSGLEKTMNIFNQK